MTRTPQHYSLRSLIVRAVATAAALGLFACGGGTEMPMGPGGPGTPAAGTPSFVSVTPTGGSIGVAIDAPLTLRWGTPMAPLMEQLVDLHQGDLSGPVVPMTCTWSADRTALGCTAERLRPQTTYTLHLGGGMLDHDGQPVDVGQYGPGYGGQWVSGMLMGTRHGGAPWGSLGPGWRHRGGSYGMAFTFTTA